MRKEIHYHNGDQEQKYSTVIILKKLSYLPKWANLKDQSLYRLAFSENFGKSGL